MRAMNAAGDGEWSTAITARTEMADMTLGAPSMVTATVSGSDVTVDWTNGENALSHLVLLFDTRTGVLPSRPHRADGRDDHIPGCASGTYMAVVVAFDADVNIQLSLSNMVTVPGS